jgi:hypothetical protein
MNTDSSGSGRVDDIKGHPQGEIRGLRNLKIPQDVRRYAAEQGIGETEALESALKAKAKEFKQSEAEVYARA